MSAEAYLDRLKTIHLFRGLKDEEVLEIASALEPEEHPAGEVLFQEGDPGDAFFIIHRGQVQVTRVIRGKETLISRLVAGDYFGELSLMRGTPRTATITTATAVELLRLSRADFDRLLKKHPAIKFNLVVTRGSREILQRQRFTWLDTDEVIYLVTRRSNFILYAKLLLPALGALFLGLAAGALIFLDFLLGFWVWVPLALAELGYIGWEYLDWSNDYYIVTNRRVIWLEKIVGLYDSRQEAPLRTVLSVNVETDPLGRSLNYGRVIVKTFTGSITFDSVPHPLQMAGLVEEHWRRTQSREKEVHTEAMREALRVKIGLQPKPASPLPAPPKPPAKRGLRLALPSDLFRVRFEAGNVVTYRKHWFVLITSIWQPSALLLFIAGLVGLRLGGFLREPLPVSVLLGAFLLALPVAIWWLYEYVDWRNDIYQVTPDQIVDISRKPLSNEVRKAAPLENVLSTSFEREGILGRLLNYGNVIVKVGVTEFRFDGVFDPVGVQQDIYRRQEMRNVRKAQAEAASRREEISDWLSVYHTIVNEKPEATPVESSSDEASGAPPSPLTDQTGVDDSGWEAFFDYS